jgi:phosphatidylinositol alpha-1,6-mannosyltransferase
MAQGTSQGTPSSSRGPLLITERYLPHQGGSRRYYHELARRLPGCTVLTGHEPGEREFDRDAGVRIVRRPGIRGDSSRKGFRTRSALVNVLILVVPKWLAILGWTSIEVARRRPRLIHAGGHFYPGGSVRIIRSLLGIPYVVYVHGEDISADMNSRHFAKYMRWVFRGALRVVANSETTAARVERNGVERARIVVARPGIDLARIGAVPGDRDRQDARARLALGPGPILLSVGRLARHKGFETVVRALPILEKAWPTIAYLVVGEGDEKDRLAGIAADLGVRERVTFLGELDDRGLRDAFAAADLFTQPNGEFRGVSEGYGMVYLEAGAAGLAVIGGRSGGVVEAVVDGVTGLLATPWDVDDFASLVTRLLEDDDLRKRMGEAGRRLAHERTWDSTLAPALQIEAELRAT